MRRRKAGLLGLFLFPSGLAKVVAGGLAAVMVVSVATGDSVTGQQGGAGAYAALHGPRQVWGSAAADAGDHFEGRPANRTLPASVRSRYPKQVWDQKTDNTITEAEPPPSEVTGFNEKTSTEQPARRSEYERVCTNTDGTETTEFSAGNSTIAAKTAPGRRSTRPWWTITARDGETPLTKWL